MKIKQILIANLCILQVYKSYLGMYNQTVVAKQTDYPISFTYINKLASWWPPQKIASSLGVPQYASYHMYNYVALAFWTYQHGPVDAALLWDDPMKYFGGDNPFGKSKDQVQKFLKEKYNKNGVKILVSAFGATQFPTTLNIDPTTCAIKLSTFVKQNNLDGVDIDWQDNPAMQAGTGQQWIITFTRKLRENLPNHIISHAPQAPYFCKQHYKNGAYVNVHQQVGNLIDFYNVQFYNQGDTTYDNFQKLFVKSGGHFPGTSVKEICERGVPLNKIVVGKPALQSDAYGSGWMSAQNLKNAVNQANSQGKWNTGVMLWQYFSDSNGEIIKTVISQLKSSGKSNF